MTRTATHAQSNRAVHLIPRVSDWLYTSYVQTCFVFKISYSKCLKHIKTSVIVRRVAQLSNKMKERASSATKDRTFDADGYIQRAGCLCFKTDSEKEVCIYYYRTLFRQVKRYHTTLRLYITHRNFVDQNPV